MTNYNVDLTPQLINLASEGSMDTSILNGKSLQRTFSNLLIENENQRKIVGRLADGSSFNNTIETVGDYGNLTAEQTPAWQRPAEWLALPSVENEQRFAGLFAIYPDGNFLAVSASGAYTVNWGDGSVTNHSSGSTAYHEYTYGDISDLNEDVLGYRQVIVQIYPQAGQNLTALNVVELHDQSGLNANYSVPWLDIAINAPSIASFVVSNGSYINSRLHQIAIYENSIADASSLLRRLPNLVNAYIDAANITNMTNMFGYCYSLQTFNIINSNNVTNTTYMFDSCRSLETVPYFDTSSVTDMEGMFFACQKLRTIPLLNTSNVTIMESMFGDCWNLESIPLIDTSNVTNVGYMFGWCASLKSIPLLDFSSVQLMSNFAKDCYLLETVPDLNTSNAISLSAAFAYCYNLKSLTLSDCSNVTSMNNMFLYCESLHSVSLSNTSNVTYMNNMFNSCVLLNDVSYFETSSVVDISSIFDNCYSLTVGALNGTSVNISYANCKLSATQLNAIYTGLATVTAKTITVTGNYGTTSDNPTIATAKGWTVTS